MRREQPTQELMNIDLTHDERSVCLTIVALKSDDSQVGELLRGVSRAFADTERVTEDWLHVELERQVEAFEDATHFKFVWERPFWGKAPRYPQRLADNLAKYVVRCSRH